jgi:hypothetical protein
LPGGASGCSLVFWLATTHETWGRVPASASALMALAMSTGVLPVDGTDAMPFWYSALLLEASANWVKYASALSVKLSAAFW